MNQLVLAELDPRAWRAQPPGKRGRTIAGIFSHVHNVRRKWLRLSAPHLELPAAPERLWPLGLGKALEGLRFSWSSMIGYYG